MKSRSTTKTWVLGITAFFVAALCALVVFGCTSDNATGNDASDNDGATVEAGQVTGVIVEISEQELLIEAEEDTNGSLTGSVRVDISGIDSELVSGLGIGDTVIVDYPGIVGMSEPPFISANSLEVKM